jgi:hypothetical protein
MRKEYFESGYYGAKYFLLDCLVNTLQDNGLYSWQKLAKKPIQNDSPLPNYDRLDNPIVAHYGDIEFIINYNNQEKEEEWYLKEETPEEEKQRDLYNILINTLWEDEKYCENGKYGIKDCRGRVILPAEYDDCLGGLSSAAYISPEEMIIVVKQNGKWGFVKRNSASEQVVSFKYDSIEDTLNGVYITNIGELYGIIGKRGIEILPTAMEDIYQPSFEGHIIYKQDGKYGFRLKNKSRSTELFDEVNLDSEEYLSVCRNGEWGYIDENAQFTTDVEKSIRNIGFELGTMIEAKMRVDLTQEMINNLPRITDEELNDLDSLDDNYVLESFNERCDIIDTIYDRYRDILSHEQITKKINEEFKRRGIEYRLK